MYVKRLTTDSSNPPVYAGLGVCYLVQAGHPKSVRITPLPLVHEVAECQHDLKDLSEPFASDDFHGCDQNSWKKSKKKLFMPVQTFTSNPNWPLVTLFHSPTIHQKEFMF